MGGSDEDPNVTPVGEAEANEQWVGVGGCSDAGCWEGDAVSKFLECWVARKT